MAITKNFSVTGLGFSQRIVDHPLLVAAVIGLGLIVWLSLSMLNVLFDRPLPPEKISAHRLRVNSDQLTKLQATITDYQVPLSTAGPRPDLFGPEPKSSSGTSP